MKRDLTERELTEVALTWALVLFICGLLLLAAWSHGAFAQGGDRDTGPVGGGGSIEARQGTILNGSSDPFGAHSGGGIGGAAGAVGSNNPPDGHGGILG